MQLHYNDARLHYVYEASHILVRRPFSSCWDTYFANNVHFNDYCAVYVYRRSALVVFPCLYFYCIPPLFIYFRIIVDSECFLQCRKYFAESLKFTIVNM